MSKNSRKAARGQVLTDHRQVGKRFIPPLVEVTGGVEGVKWVEQILPELLWLGLLNETHLAEGPDLAISLMKAAKEATARELPKDWFATASSYLRLSEGQKQTIVASLTASQKLEPIRLALAALVAFYPECPLAFLFHGVSTDKYNPNIKIFKIILDSLLGRRDRPAMLAQASVVYLGFVSDMLKIMDGMSLGNFPEISNYPHTEESQRVGASVRAVVSGFFGIESGSKPSPWAVYFGIEDSNFNHAKELGFDE